MTKEGMIKSARYRLEGKSQERHFSDESVLNMKRGYEIRCERYESKIKELEAQIEKMKWHDLRKDPTDVPNSKRRVWCITSDGNKEGFYDKEQETPWIIGSSYWSTIIAWCELPKWEIKENEGE